MDPFKTRCNAHNVIHGNRETCPKCVEVARARVQGEAMLSASRTAVEQSRKQLNDIARSAYPDGWAPPTWTCRGCGHAHKGVGTGRVCCMSCNRVAYVNDQGKEAVRARNWEGVDPQWVPELDKDGRAVRHGQGG